MHLEDSDLWKETKILLNQDINIIIPLCTANQLVISDADKYNVFRKYYTTHFLPTKIMTKINSGSISYLIYLITQFKNVSIMSHQMKLSSWSKMYLTKKPRVTTTLPTLCFKNFLSKNPSL
jgi:hypothetical protein